jgi:hypothetical protein
MCLNYRASMTTRITLWTAFTLRSSNHLAREAQGIFGIYISFLSYRTEPVSMSLLLISITLSTSRLKPMGDYENQCQCEWPWNQKSLKDLFFPCQFNCKPFTNDLIVILLLNWDIDLREKLYLRNASSCWNMNELFQRTLGLHNKSLWANLRLAYDLSAPLLRIIPSILPNYSKSW